MGVVYMVASGKGGTGKTTVTANLGAALALNQKRVALIDGDIGLRNLDMALGLENRVLFDMADVLDGRCPLESALLRHGLLHTLYLLPAPQNRTVADMPDDGMQQMAAKLAENFDFVLVDAPAGVGRGFAMCGRAADGLIAVTLPEQAALRDCDRLMRMSVDFPPQRQFLVLNRLNKRAVKQQLQQSVEMATQTMERSFSVVIPEDIAVATPRRGLPAACRRRSPAGRAVRALAAQLIAAEAVK